jgi:leucyl aminopeptidase
VNITARSGDPLAEPADALVLPAFTNGSALRLSGLVGEIDQRLDGELGRLAADARYTGKRGSVFALPTLGRLPARRIVLAGIGEPDKLSTESIRRAWGAATTTARDRGASDVLSALPPTSDALSSDRAIAAAAEGASLATYRFTRYYGAARKDDPAPREVASLTFLTDDEDAAGAVARGAARANAVALARDLANEPASVLNPAAMAEHAQKVALEQELEIKVFGPAELAEMGAGGMVNVGKGSANEPRLIHLVYRPAETAESAREIGLVGKCITFDTGGYSIKPYEGMLEMKGDMAGGAAVLGAMSALRAVDCPHIVHGVICAAENMISGEAFRPGDILTAMNGVTMEILSTDAEGRLVLADGLVYAARQGARELVDLATLTGAIVVALGDGTAGLFCNNDGLAERLQSAAAEAGERVWRMPLIEELKEQIKGDVGDIKNTGGRPGGAITAALFIQHFCEGLPWAHIDIAGCNRTSKASAYTPKGATGWGVRTLLEYVGAA